MDDRVKILVNDIREMEDTLTYIAMRHAPFSYKGYMTLINQIEQMKKELATLEAMERKLTRKFIMEN